MRAAAALLGAICIALSSSASADAGSAEDSCEAESQVCGQDAKEHRKRVNRFDLKTAEALARSGFEGARVFVLDDYGRDMPMASVLRGSAGTLAVEARALRKGRPARISAQAGAGVWSAVDAITLDKTPQYAPEVNTEGDLVLCMHSWSVIVERLKGGQVTRRAYSGCQSGNGYDRAWEFQAAVSMALPQCARLSGEHYWNQSETLDECADISGPDPVAAADIVNRMRANLRYSKRSEPLESRNDVFDTEVKLQRKGEEPLTGRTAVAGLWFREATEHQTYLPLREVTVDGAVGRASGWVIRHLDEKSQIAPFTQDWARGEDGVWRLRHWTIGSYKDRDD